jgi:zinc protease
MRGRYGLALAVAIGLAAAAQAQVQGTVQAPRSQPKPAEPAGRGAASASEEEKPAPAGRGGGRAAAAAAGLAHPRDLKFPPLRPLQTPNLTPITLANGMKLVLLEDHELPVINGVAMVHAGTLMDPAERIGLALVTAALLRGGGTAAKTPDQMDNLLETTAATIDSAADESVTRVTFSTMKQNVGAVLGMFKETLTQPEFRQDKLDAARAQLRALIAARNEDPASVARRELTSLIYGRDNPFGWMPQYATVDRISRKDVRAFYTRHFYPANTTLGIWGDFDPAQMKAAVEKEFGDWTVAAQGAETLPKVRESAAPGVYLAERKEAPQTFFAIGQMGGRVDDKDLPALQVMCAVLGVGSRGRLPEKARTKTGAPHEIRATWAAAFEHPGLFEITGSTRNVGTTDVLRVMKEEVEKIRTAEITEEELHTSREALLNALVYSFDTRAKLMGRQLLYDFHGYPKDYLAQYQKSLQAVTRADVLRVAKEHIAPEKLTMVVVGNPQMFVEPLEKIADPVNKLDLTIPESKVEPVETTEATLAEGKALLQKAQTAMGGVEKLAAIKDYTQVGQYQIAAGVANIGGSKVTETDKWIAPTTFRQESVLAAGRVAAYTDGKMGWIATPQGWGGLSGTQLKQTNGDLFRSWFRLLLSDRIDGRTVNAVDGTSVQVTDPTGEACKVEFDPDTGLPRRVTYDTHQAIGPPLYTEDLLEDFREVDGIKLPFKITINQSGKKFADVTVVEYKLNSGLKTIDLSRRPM